MSYHDYEYSPPYDRDDPEYDEDYDKFLTGVERAVGAYAETTFKSTKPPTPSKEIPLNPTKLIENFLKQGGWQYIPRPEKSIEEKTRPLTRAEQQQQMEDYYYQKPAEPKHDGFFRYVEDDVETVFGQDPMICVVAQLNGLFQERANITESFSYAPGMPEILRKEFLI